MALFDGFSQLAPGQQVRSFFGTASDLFKDPPIVPIKVSVTYQNAADQSATAAFILDINQFRGMSEVGRNADDRIAGALEKLERSFKSVVSGGRVSVLVETPEEVRREREEAFARIRADIERGEPPLAAPPEQIT